MRSSNNSVYLIDLIDFSCFNATFSNISAISCVVQSKHYAFHGKLVVILCHPFNYTWARVAQ
jgi:hypothetical protein